MFNSASAAFLNLAIIYAQIAHKLGLYSLKSELEDIALKYLEPKDYEHIVTKLEESAEERRAFIARFLVPIEEVMLGERVLPAEYLTAGGTDVTEAFCGWCRPLLGPELPSMARLL